MSHASLPVAKPALGSIVKINFMLLQSALWSFGAWWLWPDSWRDYGLGLLAIISGLIAMACLIAALQAMVKLYHRDRMMAAYLKQGQPSKTSTLASYEALKKAGMK